ncbi:hypothetical protein EJ07DRAFT_103383, partial [Lizonia empirigonia]
SAYNALLTTHGAALQTSHPDATALQFDVDGVLNRLFDDAGRYGFRNTTAFCPG